MHIKIYPVVDLEKTYKVSVDSVSIFAEFKSYDAAVSVANAISHGAVNPSGVVSIDYHECL